MINIFPTEEDFTCAEMALDMGDVENVNLRYFQHYVALIAMCVRRGHKHVADIVGQLAPLIGSENADHVIWLIEVLSGPASDVHFWDEEGADWGKQSRGSAIYLKPELDGPASTLVS